MSRDGAANARFCRTVLRMWWSECLAAWSAAPSGAAPTAAEQCSAVRAAPRWSQGGLAPFAALSQGASDQ